MDERIILEPERKLITGVGRSKWYQLEAEGKAPPRREVSGKRTGHLLSELVGWVKARPIAHNEPPRAALAARGITTQGAA
jgi:prophage regulatory protein